MRYLFIQCLRLGGLFRPAWQKRCFVFERGKRVLRFDSLDDTGCVGFLRSFNTYSSPGVEQTQDSESACGGAFFESNRRELPLDYTKTFGVLFLSEVTDIYVPSGPFQIARYPSLKQPRDYPYSLALTTGDAIEYWAFSTQEARHQAALLIEAGRIGITQSTQPPPLASSWVARSLHLPFSRDPRSRLFTDNTETCDVDGTPNSVRALRHEQLLQSALELSFYGEQCTPLPVIPYGNHSPSVFATLSPITSPPSLSPPAQSSARPAMAYVASPLRDDLAVSDVDEYDQDYYVVVQEFSSPDDIGRPLIPISPGEAGDPPLNPDLS